MIINQFWIFKIIKKLMEYSNIHFQILLKNNFPVINNKKFKIILNMI